MFVCSIIDGFLARNSVVRGTYLAHAIRARVGRTNHVCTCCDAVDIVATTLCCSFVP